MSLLPQFTNAIARYKIRRLDELVTQEKATIRIHPLGITANKIFLYCSAIRPLIQEMRMRLPLIKEDAQPMIGVSYGKINSLLPHLKRAIDFIEKSLPDEVKCMKHYNKANDILSQIQQYIPYLCDAKAPTMSKHIESISKSLSELTEFIEKITANTLKYENALKAKIKPLAATQLSVATCTAASLTACELLFIDIVFMNSLDILRNSRDTVKQCQSWVSKIRLISDTLLEKAKAENNDLLVTSQSASAKIPQLAGFLGQVQPLIKDNVDLARTVMSLITLQQALKDLESKIQLKSLSDVMKNVSTSFLKKKPMDGLIQMCKAILNSMEERISGGEAAGISRSTIAAFKTLKAMIDNCSGNSEITALTLISICRFAATQYPDAMISEELLISLTEKITSITKSIFKEAQTEIDEFGRIMMENLEFFSEKPLAEANYFYVAGKSITDFNADSDDFVIKQQLFFDALCALPTPLTRLIAACSDQTTKQTLSEVLKRIQPIANRFGRWLNQYYTTLTAIVHGRAESALAVLGYPLKSISGVNDSLDSSLLRVQATANSLQQIMATTPQNLTFDFGDILQLISLLQDLADSGNEYIRAVSQVTGSPLYLLLHIAAQTLPKIGQPLPIAVQVIPSLLNFEDDNAAFVGGMLSNLSRALSLSKEAEPNVNSGNATAAFYFATPFTYILTADAMISSSGSKGTTLVPYSAPLRSSIDVVWNIVTQVSLGENPPEAAHLPTYAASIIKTTSDLMNAACAMPQPMLRVKIPASVQFIKQYEEMAASLSVPSMKQFAPVFIRIMKRGISTDIKDVLGLWFDSAQSPPADLMNRVDSFIKAASKCAGSDNPDKKQFKTALTKFSTALADNEGSYGPNLAPTIHNLHVSFLEKARDYLDSKKPNPNAPMEMIAEICLLKSLPVLSELKQKDLDEFKSKTINGIVKNLHSLRSKGRDADFNDIVAVLITLKRLEGFYSQYPSPSPLDVQTTIESLVEGMPKKSSLDNSIKYYSEKLDALVPCLYRAVDRIRDSDAIIDITYDKADLFKDMSNKVISGSSGKGSESEMNSAISGALCSVAQIAILAFHTINLAGLRNTPLTLDYAQTYSGLQKHLIAFANDAQKARRGGKDSSSTFRSTQREMTKELDHIITIIETPQQADLGSPSAFRQMQLDLYGQFGMISTQVARIIELACSSLVPEMFTENRRSFQDALTSELEQMNRNISAISSKTNNKQSDIVGGFEKLDRHSKKLMKDSANLRIGSDPCPVLQILDSILDSVTDIYSLSDMVDKMADVVSVAPDPDAAAKIPDDYVLPPAPSDVPSHSASFEQMQLSAKNFGKAIESFKQVIQNQAAKSGEIVSAIVAFRASADKLGESGLQATVATSDLKARVNEQTALYRWGSNITNVQNAVRSRLLRIPGFEDEMNEALDYVISATENLVSAATEASKASNDETDESLDEVSKQLISTAREVESIITKIASYEDKVGHEGLVGETKPSKPSRKSSAIKKSDAGSAGEDVPKIADPANTKALPGFLIACTKIVLTAAGKTVNRARELTHEMIERLGHIENERGLIKAAAELSEASKLLMIVADLLIEGGDADVEFKIIAASKIIRGAVASLISSVLVKGGDPTGVMDSQLKIINRTTDHIIKTTEAFVNARLDASDEKEPKKATNPMIIRLNMQQQVNNQRKVLEEEEKKLYAFRRSR